MKTIQDMMTVTVEIRVKARPAEPESCGDNAMWTHYSFCLGAGADDAFELCRELEAMREAILSWRLYGWMAQQCAEAQVESGEIVEITPAEMLAEMAREAAEVTP